MSDNIIVVADTRHSQRWSERGLEPLQSAANLVK